MRHHSWSYTFSCEAKQDVLETVSILERSEKVIDILATEMEIAGLEKRINARSTETD